MRRAARWGLLGSAMAVVCVVAFQIATWPDVTGLARTDPQSTAFIERYRERQSREESARPLAWEWKPAARISSDLARAVLAGEDLEFFAHRGFSVFEVRAALHEAWRTRSFPRGASTITQQVAKNLWLTPSRNPWRKVKEAILTYQLERHLTKLRILELYVNIAEFGPGVYGAEAAARYYFGKPAQRVGEREAALLAASLPRPATWNPGSLTPAYSSRANRIRDIMYAAPFLQRRVAGRFANPEAPVISTEIGRL